MPNTSNDDVIIVGSLSDKELRESIDKLVDYVGNQTSVMASNFVVSMDLMKGAMKDFAITQKVSVDLMQDAWKQMSASFDAMLKAQQNATSSGNNSGAGGANAAQEGTIGWLREQSRLQSQIVDQQKIGTAEKQKEVDKHAAINSQLKEELKSTKQIQQETAKRTLKNVLSLPQNELKEAEYRLKALLNTASAYKTRKAGILSEEQWHKLNNAIAKTRQQIDNLQEKKPKSLKEVLGMDASSLDAIQAKMKAIANFRLHVNADAHPKLIQRLNLEYDELHKKQLRLMGQNASLARSNNYLAQSFGYIRNRLVYALTLSAISNFTKELYRIRGQYELLERSLGVLLDDMGKGSQIFRELNAMSLKSPFTLIDLAGAAKQLTAYNFAADEVVDTTHRLADISAALGVPMERLVYNLGQIRAQNVLNARDARDFANAGLPIVSMLADMYTEQKRFGDEMVTTANVYDMMSKKMVSYADVLQVINKVTDEGGKFFDFQAKQADTLQVQMANLNLAYNNMLNSIGKENQGVLAGGLSIVKDLLLNWRQVYRVLMTLITTYGAYRAAVALVGWEHKRTFGARMLISIQQWVNGIKNAKTAMQALNAAMSSNVLGLFVSALAAAVSYFWLFNNSADEMKEKLKEIQETFTSMRSNATDIFVSGLKSDNVNTQIDKLKELVSFAESELGITIPVNIQDVDAENVAQKLRDAKNYIDEYLDFAQAFSETAAGNKYLNEYFTEFGNTAQSTFTNIYSSVNTVIEGLQKLADEGRASARDLEILEELVTGKKEDESKLEYLQRLVSLYEELGLIGRKVVTPVISYTHSTEDNMEFLEEQQKKTLDRIKVHNKQVFATMLQDVQDFYSNANIAEYQLERTVKELAERIDINSIPEDQRTLKLSAAINEEASKNNWNDFAKQYARQVANTKFGTTIEISDESKKNTEVELKEWQKKLQSWADANGIALGITLNFNTTEVDAANEALQNVKKAQELLAVQQRKLKVGTATQADVDAAEKALKNARLVATQAGADLASLNRKGSSGGSKKDDVLDVLKDEISLVKKLQSEYDKLTKSGVKSADAVVAMQDAYGSTIRLLNKDLQKFGLPSIELSSTLGKNPHEILAVFTELRNILESKGLSNLERMKAVEGVIEELKVSAKTYDMKKVTDGLNSELGKIKDEYELAIELDANPELGGIFADMFGINTSTLPKTFGDALDRAQIIINRKLAEMNITTPFDLMEGNIDSFAKSTGLDKDGAVIKELVSAQNAYRDMFKKNITETEKMLDDYIKKYGDYSDKIAEIEAGRLEKLKKLNEAYYTEEMRKRPEYTAKLNAIEQGASKEKQQVDFDDFKNSRYYTMMFENLDYISTKTIRDMRDRVHELIDTMNDLTPEQLKTLMSQYEKLEQKLVKRSPFKTLTKDLKEYFATSKERKAANQEFKNAQKEYDAQKKNVAALKEKYEQAKANSNTSKSYLDFLQIEIGSENEILQILKQQLDAAQKKADKYNLTAKLAKSEALQVAQVVGQNLQSLGELRDFLQQDLGVELSDELNGLVDGLSKVGQGINKITSAATSGDVVGVITGVGQTIYGIYDGIASIFGGGSASDKKITKQIEDSERAVKRLELAYKNLEVAIEDAYGTNVIGAKQAAIANKELQLAELQRQLALEKSRDSKKRDDDRIIELQGQIIDLQNDIKRSAQEITTELLGISSVGDAALSFMDAYISALRKGEDAQAAFTGSWKEMIANMIKQLWVTKVIGPQLEALFDDMNKRISERSKTEADAYRNAVDKKTRLSTMNGKEILSEMTGLDINLITWDMVEQFQDAIDAYVSSANADVEKTKKELDKATTPTIEDMDMVAQAGEDLLPLLQASDEQINELLKKYGLYEDQSGKTLSALQQGINGITEDTAGALEGITNGISQQCYLQSDLLTQIRDAVVSMDVDVSLGVMSQILLQLQSSYQLQQSMLLTMENWTNPSGNAVRVELIS